MGSQSSKFGPESANTTHRREYAFDMITSNSKSGLDSKYRKTSGFNSAKETNLVNTSFKWTHGGNTVFLTGTFTAWKDHYPLQKVGNEFTGILRLPRGKYYYKFIVDGEWRFSPSDPTIRDELGNTNNIVDTTEIESMNKMMGSNSTIRKSEVNDSSKTTIEENSFMEEAPALPAHLKGIYFLNERDKKKEEEEELEKDFGDMEIEINRFNGSKEERNARREFIENKSVLSPPTHVTLNHLGIYGSCPTNGNNYCVTTMSQRFRSKYATVKFYSSKFAQVH